MGNGPYPGKVDWLALADAARRNAAGLLQDARLLHEHGRHARAHALGVLGLEELGKYNICLRAASGLEDVQQHWKNLGHHTAKLEHAAFAAVLFSASAPSSNVVSRVEQAVAQESAAKLQGLYVDWTSGRVATPEEVLESAATEILDLLAELVAFTQSHDLSLLDPRAREVDLGAVYNASMEDLQKLADYAKTLEPEQGDALMRTAVDDVVRRLRELFKEGNEAPQSVEDKPIYRLE